MDFKTHCDFSWIVDHPNGKWVNDDELAFNRKFAVEFGMKSDRVGWCNWDDAPLSEVERLSAFAAERNVQIRGFLHMTFEPKETEWYILKTSNKDLFLKNYLLAPLYPVISAYPICAVPEKLKKELEKLCGDTIDFLWKPDKGRFQAEQYFSVLPHKPLPMVYDHNGYYNIIKNKPLRSEKLRYMGKTAHQISMLCDELFVFFSPVVVKEDIPDCAITGFAYRSNKHHDENLFIRKDLHDFLIQKRLLKENDFQPLLVFSKREDVPPCFHPLELSYDRYLPKPEFWQQNQKEYEAFLKKKRPKREVTEKQALKLLRMLKKEKKEFFNKALSVKQQEVFAYPLLLPYYQIANGGYWTDEYRIFTMEELPDIQTEFEELQALENFTFDKSTLVFGQAIDGEYLLLMKDGKVIRYQMGNPEISNEWTSLPLFIEDLANEETD